MARIPHSPPLPKPSCSPSTPTPPRVSPTTAPSSPMPTILVPLLLATKRISPTKTKRKKNIHLILSKTHSASPSSTTQSSSSAALLTSPDPRTKLQRQIYNNVSHRVPARGESVRESCISWLTSFRFRRHVCTRARHACKKKRPRPCVASELRSEFVDR